MSTAGVVATGVNTSMSEAGCRQHGVEQPPVNDRSLLERLADGDANVRAATAERIETSVVTDTMHEGEFMDYMLNQLEAGEIEPIVRFSDEEWEDDGDIGEDFSRYPFFY